MRQFMPEKIFVEESVLDLPLTRRILSRCRSIPNEKVPSAKDLIRSWQGKTDPGLGSKKNLLLCRNRGRFLEPCPGTKPPYCCCGYAILNIGTGCPLDCSYCVLQAYLNSPFITLFVNLQDMLDELEASTRPGPGKVVRIGTGEYMDSLALEHLTDFTRFILPFFRKRKGVVLELKTKTTHIRHLQGLDHGGSIIVSWSLNAEEVAQQEEPGAAPIRDRLEAAQQLIGQGYRVGFHFDPLIYYPGWEKGYRDVVGLLAERIPASSIAWISIGSLRYMPRLKSIARKCFPDTRIFAQEFVPGLDGKMRYLQEIRLEMYLKLVSWLKDYAEDLCIYFCMENPTVWEKTLGFAPSSNAQLKKLLDQRV